MATDVLEVLEDAIALDEIQAASEALETTLQSISDIGKDRCSKSSPALLTTYLSTWLM